MRPDRRQVLAALLAAGFAGVAQAQVPALSVPPPRRPAPRASRLIAQSGLGAHIVYAVLGPDGQLAEGRGADQPVAPASTLKVLTALYALDRLGAGHRFATRVLRAGDMLVLAGGGDPLLDSDGLDELARMVAQSGQGTPARFAVWGGALPAIHEIAPGQAAHLAYNPGISGMMLNFNRVHLGWQAGGAAMALQARAARHSPVAYTVRAEAVTQGPLFSWREEGGREIWRVNRAGLGRAGSRWLPVRNPEAYAGDVFQTLCRAEGLPLPAPQVTDAAPEGEELARHDSPPLTEILTGLLEFSTNLTAEAVGLAASGEAGLEASAAAMARWLEGVSDGGTVRREADHGDAEAAAGAGSHAGVALIGAVPHGRTQGAAGKVVLFAPASGRDTAGLAAADSATPQSVPHGGTPPKAAAESPRPSSIPHDGTPPLRFLDHSGLSGENRMTARALAELLARPSSRAALDGLLKRDPLREALGDAARGGGGGVPLVRAKTGTLNFVSGLAGYAEAAGEAVAFAILAADTERRAANAGRELPEGSAAWVKRAKELQRDLIEAALRPPRQPSTLPPEI